MANISRITLQTEILEGTSTQICERTFADDDAAITQYLDDQITVAAGAVDTALSLASVGGSAKNIMITFSEACTVRLNGIGNTAIAIAAGGGALVFANGTITSMHVSNAAATSITVKRVASS